MGDILLVTGSRDGLGPRARGELRAAVERSREVVVGDARGVDAVARAICEETGTLLHVFAADWDSHGKGAGPRRNTAMVRCVVDTLRVRRPDYTALCVAYPARGSRGTWDCVRQATEAGIPVLVRRAR